MKACRRCCVEKPLSEYYRHKQMADGHLNYCKDCKRSESISNRNDKLDYYRAYDRRRANQQQRIEARNNFANSEAGKISQSRAKAAYIARNPIVRKANNAVSNALRDRRLVRMPCEVCGSVKYIHAHHDDYKRPLSVRWLCALHHSDWHKTNDPAF
jgi:hypothetical protein